MTRAVLWVLVYGFAIIGAGATLGLLTGVVRFGDETEPVPVSVAAPASVVVVVTATPVDAPAPLPTRSIAPTLTPVIVAVATNTLTPSPTPSAMATRRPADMPVPTMTPTLVATVEATSTPTSTASVTATATPALICGYVQMVLMGAGKEHDSCQTPTPTAQGLYDIATATPEREIVLTKTPRVVRTPIPTRTAVATFTPVGSPTAVGVVVMNPTLSPYLEKLFAEITPVKPDIDIEELEDRIYESLNNERLKEGLQSLNMVREVRLIARSHSEDMVSRDFYAHESPDGFGPRDRSVQADFVCPGRSSYGLGENIAQISLHGGYIDRNGVMDIQSWYTLEGLVLKFTYGWMNSRGHRANILESSYSSTGVGVAISENYQVYATQNFC